MKDKIIIFIDLVAAKNKLQVTAIESCGLSAHFLVYNYREKSNAFLVKENTQVILKQKWLANIYQVFQYLKKNRKTIHHLEIYPGGALSFIYLVIGRFFKLKTICVERGDLLYFHRLGYSRIVRFSMWFCYRFSSITWYREFYMEPLLKKAGAKNLFFLHNAVDIKNNFEEPLSKKDICFLWLNRVITERRYNWFIDVLKKRELNNTVNYLVGLINSNYNKEQEIIRLNKPDNLILKEYTDTPSEYFKRAKFFVLPAEVVFANNALLEAMSYGVVPLISNQPGAELIVENEKNGFIFQHSYEDFEKTIMKAYNLDDLAYSEFSAAAKEKIIKDFSAEKYIEGIKKLYAQLNSLQG
jgi:glycosyltransferase involved in cell wall biosynthesis